ncbi:acyltransferase family protein [Rhodococcus globerulus]|uniref:acyltransferase family protein n=1 Tax=Rhodococcus globerulus TaxID=33008 RepID=UPI0039E97E6D
MNEQNQRLPWPDLAKATCIILVVIGHTAESSVALNVDAGTAAKVWDSFVLGLTPIRVPVFFLISGWLAVRAIQRPWQAVVGPKVLNNAYLYALWLAIYTVIFGFGLTMSVNHPSNLADFFYNLLVPINTLWYLWALIAYFLIMRGLRSAPAFIPIALGAVLSLTAGFDSITDVVPGYVLRGFVFFAVGAAAPALVEYASRTANGRTLAAALAAFLVAALVVRYFGLGDAPLIPLLNAIPGCWLGITAATVVARTSVGERFGAYIGQRTLPIYVTHLPIVAACNVLIWERTSSKGLDLVWPLIVAVVVTGIALALYAACQKLRFTWTFGVPQWSSMGNGPTATRKSRHRQVY